MDFKAPRELWISKFPGSFEIHWVRQYLVNFTSLVGIVNGTVYKTEPVFTSLGHELSQFLTLWRPQYISSRSLMLSRYISPETCNARTFSEVSIHYDYDKGKITVNVLHGWLSRPFNHESLKCNYLITGYCFIVSNTEHIQWDMSKKGARQNQIFS